MTKTRVFWASCLVGIAVYLGALQNDFAFDDVPIIVDNPAAHSLTAAFQEFFSPYWPTDETTSGQYRPMVIVSFATDASLFGNRPWAFHAVNLLLHGVTSGLVAMLAFAWLPAVGALVAGVGFAVHPVHVESVANVVGRAEVLTALLLFTMLLAARRFRMATSLRARRLWLVGVITLLWAALLTKEHAVVGVALVAVDQWLDSKPAWRRSANLYLALIATTVTWLFLWSGIAGTFVDVSENATVRGLDAWQRLATMLPAQMEVVRLLVWPFELAVDYNPLVILRRTEWSVLAIVGLITCLAIIALAFVCRTKARAVTFGVLAGIISYAPTSNILFASGVVLAERNLYIAVLAPVMALGWLASRSRKTRLVLGAVSLFYLALSIRTALRAPFWKNTETVLVGDFLAHPENYRARLRLGSYLREIGNLPAALAEATAAGAVFPEDPWVALYSVVRAIDLELPQIALQEAMRAYDSDPTHPSFARLVVRARMAQGKHDLALPVARRSLIDAEQSALAAQSYVQVLDSTEADPWRRVLAGAHLHFRNGELGAATDSLEEAFAQLSARNYVGNCWDLRAARPLFGQLKPRYLPQVDAMLVNRGRCQGARG